MPTRGQPSQTPEWFAIKVVLTEGRGVEFANQAGRIFAAGPNHSFGSLASQIDEAFERRDTAHLHEFELSDGTRIGPQDEDADEELLDESTEQLSRLRPGDVFSYTFDLGDMWLHRCLVKSYAIDPVELFGSVPEIPRTFMGWGTFPEQYPDHL